MSKVNASSGAGCAGTGRVPSSAKSKSGVPKSASAGGAAATGSSEKSKSRAVPAGSCVP
ncbi:hypothetical protein COEX109129_36725 [Corallococcus exiguus]